MSITLEVCVDNPESVNMAIAGGADRIELCSALALGGLTPSAGLIDMAAGLTVPVYAMIRPRDGDFEYETAEIALMEADIRCCAEAGLAGVVIGATRNGALDIPALSRLVDAARPLGVTLHRAFDLLEDPLRTIDDAAELGIERILTSGGAQKAEDGISQIRAFAAHANDRLSIMAGSGINSNNAAEIVRQTGIRELHGTFACQSREFSPGLQSLGFASATGLMTTDADHVRSAKRKLDRL